MATRETSGRDSYVFQREPGGRVTIRLRIKPEEADAIERAAQGQKLTDWMIRAILDAAARKQPGE